MNMLAIVSDATSDLGGLIWIVVIVGLFVGMMFLNRRSQKKRQEEADKMLNAIKPGNKVKTIGGICGIVVEICPDDNTFVLETGTEASGKSYIKFDRQAIYQTDAVVEEQPVKEQPVEQAPVQEEVPVEEVPAQEENKENE